MRIWKVNYDKGETTLLLRDLEELKDCLEPLEDIETGDTFTIEAIEMPQGEIDKMGEWEGWW